MAGLGAQRAWLARGHRAREKEIKSSVQRGAKLSLWPPVRLPLDQRLGAPLSPCQVFTPPGPQGQRS